MLEQQASPRKRGEFVSKLLIEYGTVDGGVDAVDIEGMKLQIMGLAGANKTLGLPAAAPVITAQP